jgi:tRNA-dihydrouridine synthase
VISQVKRAVSIPVVGCGDVTGPDQAIARLNETGVDGVMIGRGAIANPWIFRQTRERALGQPVYNPPLSEKRRVLHRYDQLLRDELPEKALIGKLKQMCGYFTHGLEGGARLRERVFHSQQIAEAYEIIDQYFDSMIETGRPPESLIRREPASSGPETRTTARACFRQ